jgi:hypothetical protein
MESLLAIAFAVVAIALLGALAGLIVAIRRGWAGEDRRAAHRRGASGGNQHGDA